MLNAQLSLLEAEGLVALTASEPELQYTFQHPLLLEAAYSSLTRSDRRVLHQTVGTALERLYPDRQEEFAPRLGEHFLKAGDYQRAYHYYLLAGQAAQRIYANAVAAMHYAHAVKLVRGKFLPQPPDGKEYVELNRSFGRVLELNGQYTEAFEHYQAMEAEACTSEDQPLELAALIGMGTILSTPTVLVNPARAEEISMRALALARELGDQAAESRVLWNLLLSNYFGDQLDRAMEFGNQSLEIARKLNLREQMAYTMSDLANFGLFSIGELEKSYQLLEEALSIWKELKNLPMESDTLSGLAVSSYTHGDFDRGLRQAQEANEISAAIGNQWGQAYSCGIMALIYSQRGIVDRASRLMEETIVLSKSSGFIGARCIGMCTKSALLARLGNPQAGLEAAEEAVYLAKTGLTIWLDEAHFAQAISQVLLGRLDDAEATLQQTTLYKAEKKNMKFASLYIIASGELFLARKNYAGLFERTIHDLAEIEQFHAYGYQADAQLFHSLALMHLGRVDDARAAFGKTIQLVDRQQILSIAWEARASLGMLEQSAGNLQQSEKWLREARQHLDLFISHIDDPGLRDSFTALPRVQAVLQEAQV